MSDDYLEVLRERFGDDAGTREPDPADEWAETYSPCHPGCACDDRPEIRSATTPREGA